MISKRIGAYVGIDPTAPSLHVGHLIPLMALFWMYVHGFHTVTLLGGATAKIGDPTDRLVSREKVHSNTRTANMVAMHYQLKKLWVNVESYGEKYGYKWEWAWKRELVNNNAWMNGLGIMEVLQILGPGIRMGAMMAKDTVKNKMEKGDGMSFAEFTYPLLQSWDWWHMYATKGIQMQIGGSDQYGNITAGIDAVKYISANHPDPKFEEFKKGTHDLQPMGFTTPLLTTSSGQKFGKSAGNAIFLSKEYTTSFDLYGYFMKTADADVEKFLKFFTFMPMDDIRSLMEEHKQAPKERKAQRKLAFEILELVHGAEDAKTAEWQHGLLFSGKAVDPSTLQPPTPEPAPKQLGPLSAKQTVRQRTAATTLNPGLRELSDMHIELPRSLILKKSMARVVRAAGLAPTNSHAKQLIVNGSIYVGGEPAQKRAMNDASLSWTQVKPWVIEDNAVYLKDDSLFLRRGKGNIKIVKAVSDLEWRASGRRYPGQELDGLPELDPDYDPSAHPSTLIEEQDPEKKLDEIFELRRTGREL